MKSSRRQNPQSQTTLPLPGIPESPQLNMVSKPSTFEKLVRRTRIAQYEAAAEARAQADVNHDRAMAAASSSAHKIKRPKVLKSQISKPELRMHGSFSTRESHSSPKAYSIVEDGASSTRFVGYDHHMGNDITEVFPSKHPRIKHTFGLARPRLSPMEYTRMYLVEKAMAEREQRECELPAPGKQWFWTPYWEKFLIVPRIPSAIVRDRTSKQDLESLEIAAPCNSVLGQNANTRQPDSGHCPRLSLHLGSTVPGFPSLMDLALISDENWAGQHHHSNQKTHQNRRCASSTELERSDEGNPTTLSGVASLFNDMPSMPPPDYAPPPAPRSKPGLSSPEMSSASTCSENAAAPKDDVVSVHSTSSIETVVHLNAYRTQVLVKSSEPRAAQGQQILLVNAKTAPSASCEADLPSESALRSLEEMCPAPLKLTRRQSQYYCAAAGQDRDEQRSETSQDGWPRADSPTIEVSNIRSPRRVAPDNEAHTMCAMDGSSPTKPLAPKNASAPLPVAKPHRATYKLVPTVKRLSFLDPTPHRLTSVPLSRAAKVEAPVGVDASPPHNLAVDDIRTRRNLTSPSVLYGPRATREARGQIIPSGVTSRKDHKATASSSPSLDPSSALSYNAFSLQERQGPQQATILPSAQHSSVPHSSRQLYGQPNCNFSFTTRPVNSSNTSSYASSSDATHVKSQRCSATAAKRVDRETDSAQAEDRKTPRKNENKGGETTRRTPSRLASLFRRRNESVQQEELTSQVSITPAPASPWRPFEEVSPDDDVFGATWMYADDYNWANNEVLVAARREEMLAREGQGQNRLRRLSFGRTSRPDSAGRSVSDPVMPPPPGGVEMTTEPLVDFQNFLDVMPSPPPDTELPPIPSPGVRSVSRTASSRPPLAPSAIYKSKKPEGLSVGTMPGTPGTTTRINSNARNRLRKASKDSLRSASAASGSGSSRLMGVLKIGDRSFSLGKGVRSRVDDGEPRSVFED